jgi:hypothetical protein
MWRAMILLHRLKLVVVGVVICTDSLSMGCRVVVGQEERERECRI